MRTADSISSSLSPVQEVETDLVDTPAQDFIAIPEKEGPIPGTSDLDHGDFGQIPLFPNLPAEKEDAIAAGAPEETNKKEPLSIGPDSTASGNSTTKTSNSSNITEGPTEATSNEDRKEAVQTAIRFLNKGAIHYKTLQELTAYKLTDILEGNKATFKNNQQLIEDFLEGDAQLKEQLEEAYKRSVTSITNHAAQQLDQSTNDLFQQNKNQIHPVAWIKSSTDTAAGTAFNALPQDTKSKIKILTSALTISDIAELFSTKGGTTTIPIPSDAQLTFSGSIGESLKHGLKNIAGKLIPNSLPLNSTITTALDLQKYGGGNDAYRFTYAEKTEKGKDPIKTILIERLGTIGTEGLKDAEIKAQKKRFQQFSFNRGSNWSDDDFEFLLQAIAKIPDNILTPVQGLTFNQDSNPASEPSVGGEYAPDTHTITIFDKALEKSQTRFGTPGTDSGISPFVVEAITHEIGHAIDLLPLREKMKAYDQAKEVFITAFKQYEDPPDSNQYKFPNSEQARFDQLMKDIKDAEDNLKDAKSKSGARYTTDADGDWVINDLPTKKKGAFREAVVKDGKIFPTNYPNPEDWWQEFYAESFSLYFTNPLVLEQIRPNVFKFFKTNFPKN